MNPNQEDFTPHPDWISVDCYRDPPEIRLIKAMIAQAVQDYFVLHRMGAVRFFKFTGKFKRKGKGKLPVHAGMTVKDVHETVHFLRHVSPSIFRMVGWDVTGEDFCKAIMRLEASGRHKKVFGQGVPLHRTKHSEDAPLANETLYAPQDEEGGQSIAD